MVVEEVIRAASDDQPITETYSIGTTIPAGDIQKAQYARVFFGVRTSVVRFKKYATIPLGYDVLMEFQMYTSTKKRYIQQCEITVTATDSTMRVKIWRQCLKSDWDIGTRVQTEPCNLLGFTFYLNQIELFF